MEKNLDREFIEELVKQVMDEMIDDEDILTSETNVTGDIAGYDAPLTKKMQQRKFADDDEDLETEKVIDE